MNKPSNIWRGLRSAVLIAHISLLAFTPARAAVPPDIADAVQNMADQAAGSISGKFNSRKAVQENAIQPLQGSKPMIAQDGTPFDASIQCAQARPLLTAFAQPSATGDLTTLLINVDMNLDGTMDSTYSAPQAISGVCANGVATCDAGTWNNCKFWEWATTTSGVTMNEVANTDLSGCYCINGSCGSNLVWNNLSTVVRDLGAGAVRAIQKDHPDYVIADTTADASYVEFYGASGAGCRTGTTGQSDLLANPIAFGPAVQNEINLQQSDPNSIHNTINTSIATTNSEFSTNICGITRTVTVTEDTCQLQPDAIVNDCAAMETNPQCQLRDETVDGVTTYQDYSPTGLVPLPSTKQISNSTGYTTQLTHTNDTLELTHTGGGLSTQYLLSYVPSGVEHPNYTAHATKIKIKDIEPGVFWYIWVASATIGLLDYEQINSFSVTDSFGSDCYTGTLTSDSITGKPVNLSIYFNAPINSLDFLKAEQCEAATITIQIDGIKILTEPCSETVSRDWWNKQRTYLCETSQVNFNFDDALHRAEVATSTADLATGFTETHRDASGNWVSQSVGIGQPTKMPTVEPCEQVCKVSKMVNDDRVTKNSVAVASKTTTQRKEIRYPVCRENLCPTEPGETIEKDCQCINDFAEAATIMQTLRSAGQDLLCSP